MKSLSLYRLDSAQFFRQPLFFLIALTLNACGGGDGSPSPDNLIPGTETQAPTPTPSGGVPKNILVTWSANHERVVNQVGGGYRVYFSTSPGFSIVGATYIDAPYVSGSFAPTSVILPSLTAGATYYVKVVAFSNVTFPGSATPATSDPSNELQIQIP